MKPQETVPLLSTLAPAAVIAPPVVIVGAVVGLGLLWLLSREEEAETPTAPDNRQSPPPESKPALPVKKVTREDLAEALAYGARRFTRKEAVEALQTLGFRKSSAYKALSPDGKFGSLIAFTPDGLIEWNG